MAKAPKKKDGRPSLYTKELGAIITTRIASGESLRTICREEGMPEARTVHYWLLDIDKSDFFQQYERACNVRAEHLFEEILEISDASDKVVKKGAEKKSSAYSSNQRLKVDSRKWYLSKVLPKKFGDKIDVTSDNKPLPLLHVLHNNIDAKDKGTTEANSSSTRGDISVKDDRNTPKPN